MPHRGGNPLRLVRPALVLVLVAACGTDPSTTSSGSLSAPVSTTPSASPTATGPRPTVAPAAATNSPSPSPPLACPPIDEVLTVDELLSLDPACTADRPVTVQGWWDQRRDEDPLELSPFVDVLRAGLPSGPPEEGLVYGPSIPLDISEAELPFESIERTWVETRVRLAEGNQAEGDTHCAWQFGEGGENESAEPAWVCPRFAAVSEVKVVDPPDDALAGCPRTDKVIPVEVFVHYPPACFSGKSIRLSGWFDTRYVISGWEDPWEVKPGWLFPFDIGPVPVLSPSSDAWDRDALRLHIRPGTALAAAGRNRWVVLRGHYARPSEYRRCHFEYVEDWYGEPNPAIGMDDAMAGRSCARAFVAESVRDTSEF